MAQSGGGGAKWLHRQIGCSLLLVATFSSLLVQREANCLDDSARVDDGKTSADVSARRVQLTTATGKPAELVDVVAKSSADHAKQQLESRERAMASADVGAKIAKKARKTKKKIKKKIQKIKHKVKDKIQHSG